MGTQYYLADFNFQCYKYGRSYLALTLAFLSSGNNAKIIIHIHSFKI